MHVANTFSLILRLEETEILKRHRYQRVDQLPAQDGTGPSSHRDCANSCISLPPKKGTMEYGVNALWVHYQRKINRKLQTSSNIFGLWLLMPHPLVLGLKAHLNNIGDHQTLSN